jgi:alpha-tubulin suppressor-like RCC1 family protein
MMVVTGLVLGSTACFDIDLTGLENAERCTFSCGYDIPTDIPVLPFDASPVAVAGGLTFTAISVGRNHVCGVADGGAYCWGERGLGTPEYADVPAPIPVSGTEGFVRVSAGESYTCGVGLNGGASCWGHNGSGQLGNGASGPPMSSPTPVAGSIVFTTVSTSAGTNWGLSHTCGLTGSGAAYCWGGNDYGQLGNGTTVASTTPAAVSGGRLFESISVGARFTCGIVRGDGAYCWGQGTDGQLGDDPRDAGNCGTAGGQLACNLVPVRIAGSESFTSISAGDAHACAIDARGVAHCWGANLAGQLGTGSFLWRFAPTPVSTTLRFTAIAAGIDATCGLTVVGEAFCWGSNTLGQVGDGTTLTRSAPAKVMTALSFTSLSVGVQEACALTAGGAAHCWGSNHHGKLGKGS